MLKPFLLPLRDHNMQKVYSVMDVTTTSINFTFLFIAFYMILKHRLKQTYLITKKSWHSMKGRMSPLPTGGSENDLVAPVSETFTVITSFQLFWGYYGTKVLQMQTVFWDHEENNLGEQTGHIH